MVQGHDDSSGGDAQMVETEAAAGHGDGTQHAVSETNQDIEDFAHQLPRTTSEVLSTTHSKSPTTIQSPAHTHDEDEPESAIARPDSAGSFYEESRWQKLRRKIVEEPLIPLGCALTCWALYEA